MTSATIAQLGLAELQARRFAEAETLFRQALDQGPPSVPSSAWIWDWLGVAVREQGRAVEAEQCARQALALEPANPKIWLNLGGALYFQMRWPEAAEAFRQSLRLDPNALAAWSNLGGAELAQQHLPAARQAYENSLKLAPGHFGATANLIQIVALQGEREQAREMLARLTAEPVQPADLVTLGAVYKSLDDLPSAEAALRGALEHFPGHVQARQNLVLVLEAQQRPAEAEMLIGELLSLTPHSAEGWSMLGGVMHAQGRHDEAIAVLKKSVELESEPMRHGRLLHVMHYAASVTPEQLLDEHRRWDEIHAQGLFPPRPPRVTPRPTDRPLRIGFVSGDFGLHAVGLLALPLVEHLDKSRAFVACYSDREAEDSYTARYRAACGLWRRTCGVPDAELAAQIALDKIDVLVDLSGHHGNKRLLAFARKPASLQVTWLGYVGTTGMRAMDVLLADRFHVREEEEQHHSEKVFRLPKGYVCYRPPPDAPDVAPLPALARGPFTFGCFNNPIKYTPRTLDRWAQILDRTPAARLLLKFTGLELEQNQQRILRQFTERGILAQRVQFEGGAEHADFLAAYGRVDLALDTLPYSGGITTCEALWMGVPVVACPGSTFASRHATSHLTNAGFPQFVAPSWDQYVALAVDWASRPSDLAALRAQMRQHMNNSALCDAPTFSSDFLATIWRAWDSFATA